MLCLLFKTLCALNGVDRLRIERMASNRWMERRWASALEVALRPHRMCTNSSVEETELELALRTTGKTHVSAREYQYCITVVRPRGGLCDQKRQFCELPSAKIRDYFLLFFMALRKGVGIEVVTLEVIWQFEMTFQLVKEFDSWSWQDWHWELAVDPHRKPSFWLTTIQRSCSIELTDPLGDDPWRSGPHFRVFRTQKIEVISERPLLSTSGF